MPTIDGIGLKHFADVRPREATQFRVYMTAEEVAEMTSERFFEEFERLAERAMGRKRGSRGGA